MPRKLWMSSELSPHRIAYVSGSPRSGTTWVAEMVENISGCRRFFEPCKGFFQKYEREFGSRVAGGYTPHIGSGNEEESALCKYLKEIALGEPPGQISRAFDPSRNVIDNIKRIRYADGTLLKFTKMQRCIPWMSFNIDIPGAVILRSPLATVNSMIRNVPSSYRAESVELEFSDALLKRFPGLLAFHGTVATRLQRLTVMTCLDMLVAVKSKLGPYAPIFVCYEDLCETPELFNNLVLKLGLHVKHPDEFVTANRPSSTTQVGSNVSRGEDPRISYKRNLTGDDINTILSVCERIGLDFFSEDSGLNKNVLRDQGLRVLGYE